MAEPEYSKEELEVLKQARIYREGLDSELWRMHDKILAEQIALRERVLATPMHSLQSDEFRGMDFMAKAAQLESVKGAIIGLKLARELPELTLRHAQAIREDHGVKEE